MKDLWTHIGELSNIDGISGREDAVRAYLRAELASSPAALTMEEDPMGNLLVKVTGHARANKRVVLAAHMDEVGFIITGIDDDGFLRFTTVGGIANSVLFGRRVRVNRRLGVIGGKATHQCTADEKDKAPAADSLRIDLGVPDRETAQALVEIGDMVTFDTGFTTLGTGRVCGKALDDRAGCALLLELVRQIPPYDITLAFTTQEEVGLRGATVAGNRLQPDIVVVVDATTAADVAGSSPATWVCRQEHGAVISFMDRRTLYSQELHDRLFRLAASRGIAAQPKTTVAGGNDAGAFQTAGGGARVAAVSLPCRYIHSPSCVLCRTDVMATAELLMAIAEEFPV